MEKEEITTLMVDDDYAPVITEEEACELKPILNGFVEAYVQNSKKAIKEWLPQKIRLSSTKQLKKANWDADDRTSAEPFYLLLQ